MIRALFVIGFFTINVSVAHADDFSSPLPPQFSDGSQRAFPTAEGYGAVALGGRGGKVVHVTNLKDSGPGSLRDAIENQTGPRTIVFDVGGIIDLTENLHNKYGDNQVTIAGQTAPGDGVCLRGGAIELKGSDIIVRHVCTRRGDGPGADARVGDGFRFNNAKRSIADHLSISWTQDEAVEMWYSDTEDITVQYSLMYEPLDGLLGRVSYRHGFGPIFGNGSHQISFHHNVLAHNRRRSPRLSNVQDVDVINNIIFNWSGVATHISENKAPHPPSKRINVINNVYRPGINSSDTQLQIQNVFHSDAQIFFGGNQDDVGRPIDFVDNRWGTSNLAALVGEPNPRPDNAAVNIQLPNEIWDTLLDNVGARVPVLDEADTLAIAQVRDGSGTRVDCVDKEDQTDSVLLEPCVTESALGRWPAYQSVSRPVDFDSDRDGMPDDWELTYGLDPDNPEDRNGDMVGDGWTSLEYYLNQLAGDYRGTEPVSSEPPSAEEDAVTSDPISEPITVNEPVSEPPSAEEDAVTSDPISEPITVSEPVSNELPLAPAASDPVSGQITVSEPVSNQPPVPSLSWSCIDLVCYFFDTSTDGDGQITTWAWDFGDGGSSTAPNPSHTYSADGTNSVMLTVTDNDLQSDSITQSVTVSSGGSRTPDACDGLADGIFLTPSSINQGRTWTAIVDAVKCIGQDEDAFTGNGSWNPDLGGSDCVRSSTGVCQATQSGIRKRTGSVQFSIDGASITVSKH